ncbi:MULTISPECIES: transposase [Streptomyces]|uniref:transposase n=1 Tax=Streptomyces TaxID=1883 RepID=UPI001EF64DFA|nr:MULTISPECIES: transposase [Streptomyces]
MSRCGAWSECRVHASRCDDHGVGRGAPSDEQWPVLESLPPAAGVSRRRPGRQRLVDGVRWRVRTGVPWRDLPDGYGPWQSVYGLFGRRQRQGGVGPGC